MYDSRIFFISSPALQGCVFHGAGGLGPLLASGVGVGAPDGPVRAPLLVPAQLGRHQLGVAPRVRVLARHRKLVLQETLSEQESTKKV